MAGFSLHNHFSSLKLCLRVVAFWGLSELALELDACPWISQRQSSGFCNCQWVVRFEAKTTYPLTHFKQSAHTALAVKACLLGCNSATLNAQVTFVNIAVAIISALAGGGGHSKNFAPSLYIAGVFAFFRRFFGVGDQDGIEIEFWVILVPLWIEFWVILVALWCNSYSGSLKEFRTRPLYRWCFRVFSTIFWSWRSRRY